MRGGVCPHCKRDVEFAYNNAGVEVWAWHDYDPTLRAVCPVSTQHVTVRPPLPPGAWTTASHVTQDEIDQTIESIKNAFDTRPN